MLPIMKDVRLASKRPNSGGKNRRTTEEPSMCSRICQSHPRITSPPANQTVLEGDEVTLSCTGTSDCSERFYWNYINASASNVVDRAENVAAQIPDKKISAQLKDWTKPLNVEGFVGTQLKIPAAYVTSSKSGWYTCTIAAADCPTNSASAHLTVAFRPKSSMPLQSPAVAPAVLGILFLGCLIFIACIAFVKSKRRRPYNRCSSDSSNSPDTSSSDVSAESKFFIFSRSQLNPIYGANPNRNDVRSHLFLGAMLDVGQFGEVRKGELQITDDGVTTSRVVAVKTLKNGGREAELLSELDVMQSLPRHRNVIELIVLPCRLPAPQPAIIMEYAERGNLKKLLINIRTQLQTAGGDYLQPLDGNANNRNWSLYADQLDAAGQIANGMAHLAAHRVLHRDLAARNVLVTADYTMKIADFGLSRATGNRDYYRVQGPRSLPIKWIAPEALLDNLYTTQSDVWSFGVVLWEIASLGETPYGPTNTTPEVLLDVFSRGERLLAPQGCLPEICTLMTRCWDAEPEARPDFFQIVNYLRNLEMTDSPTTMFSNRLYTQSTANS